MTLDNCLHRHVKLQPDKAAVVTADRTITYADLDASVSCLARYLLDRGLRPGDRIAVHWSNSIETAQLLLAALRAGLIAVPINVRLKAPEIAYIFQHAAVRICFSEPAVAPLAKGVEVVSELPALTGASGPLPDVDSDQQAVILYTSGTTARPKGAVHTHRSLFEAACMMTPDPIGHRDAVLVMTQLAHVSGLNCGLLPTLQQGASAVLLRAFDAGAALDLIERFQCTYTLALPAMLQFVAEEQTRHPRDVSSLRKVLAGGDTVPIALQQRVYQLFGVGVREVHGMTESAPVMLNPASAIRTGSIGVPVPGVSVRLIDPQGCEVKEGETGEVLVGSPANCAGYWNDPEATAQVFDDGWLRTGDLARRDADGYYWFKGRLKQLIIRGGANISPQEVEEALYQHRAVMEAGVIGAPDSVYGEVPVAFVAVRAGHALTEDELRAHARELLADYKVPERILFVEALPKGLTGKIDRRCLRDMLIAQAHPLEKPVVAGV
jgi:acyl-CoA synthetase (AMP-forming)/AMP-acid ligase II